MNYEDLTSEQQQAIDINQKVEFGYCQECEREEVELYILKTNWQLCLYCVKNSY